MAFPTLPIRVNTSSDATVCPFDISIRKANSNYTVTLRPGAINQLLPTNIFNSFSISNTGTYYVKVIALSNGEKITSSSITIDTTNITTQTPTPFTLPSTVEILIGIIKDGTPYKTIACGSINLVGQEQFRTDKNPPADPGELVYTPYYIWAVS